MRVLCSGPAAHAWATCSPRHAAPQCFIPLQEADGLPASLLSSFGPGYSLGIPEADDVPDAACLLVRCFYEDVPPMVDAVPFSSSTLDDSFPDTAATVQEFDGKIAWRARLFDNKT